MFVVSSLSTRGKPAFVSAWFLSPHLPRSRGSLMRFLRHQNQANADRAFVRSSPQYRLFGSTTRCYQQQKPEDTPSTPSIPSIFSNTSWETSDWAIHVAVSAEDAPIKTVDAIHKALEKHRAENGSKEQQQYTAQELLQLGSAWYLASEDMYNPYKKPSRLTSQHSEQLLQEGDYLRIHFDPRRFPAVDLYDWSVNSTSTSTKPKVLVDADLTKGYLVLNKPSECIPVHATVDNEAENIVACLHKANLDSLDYVASPHRLDQNTSGLMTMATSKMFAAYYAQGLRRKTAKAQVSHNNNPEVESTISPDNNTHGEKSGIHKVYRCLVCLMPPPADGTSSNNWSVEKALQELQTNAKEATILRHYLEPSVRAPKRFVSVLPPNATLAQEQVRTKSASWQECLMRIVQVGDLCALRGNAASDALAQRLWDAAPHELMPPSCQAVVELEVELLTGRTHQIRGQLSASGYPLVNDVPYGGGVVGPAANTTHSNYRSRLALQCCQLEFLDPDIRTVETKKRGRLQEKPQMLPSERWNRYKLESAWWTPYLEEYKEALKTTREEEMTTMAALDMLDLVDTRPREKPKTVEKVELIPQSLPPQAQLSPGRNKYVIVKAIDPNTGEIYKWFVKSASPKQCGGPYHKDVARDLVEWIQACGYRAVVTGGGRIFHNADTSPQRALVYGFSYGFGRGDHALAAKVIKEWSEGEMETAYDDSPDLY